MERKRDGPNHEAFDGVICMDTVEHVFPEDWPLVLSNFHRALTPQGYLFFTVEIAAESEGVQLP